MEKDVVFIDTSVFKANNYFSATSKINKLAELASKGRISIVLTSITEAEIIRHLARDIENARKSVRKKDNEVLRNIRKIYKEILSGEIEKKENKIKETVSSQIRALPVE